MKYSRADYERFLITEIEAQIKDYEQVINTKAIILKERGDVFVGKFLRMHSNGQAVFKVRHSDNMPRKNSFWTATYFVGEMANFRKWGDLSWVELRSKYQKDFSDANCIWISKSDEADFCLVGIKGLTMEFARLLEEQENPIIAFGPKDPPLQYLYNLLEIVKSTTNLRSNSILDYEEKQDSWNPQMIDAKADLNMSLVAELSKTDCIVIQGPPGTGKTYRMAKLAAQLLSQNKSVLVTALTNQALMELAKKEDMVPYLERGKVSKSSLTVDENRELPNLQPIIDNKCNTSSGCLSLASFYVASGWAIESEIKPFDYVIMDEASQALLPMIAASVKLGSKIIWVGDQNQLPPIVLTNEDIINQNNWFPMVKGFETICRYFSFKSYMLSDTFRMTKRGAECTGVFYNDSLRSVSDQQSIQTNISGLNKLGGPVLACMDLKVGNKTPDNAKRYILDLVSKILEETPDAEIAVLAKFRETVRSIQKYFVLNWNSGIMQENIRIETVDRVQGLTVDYCIFLIPNASLRYSLEKELFNVATSRAKCNTIIIADESILRENMSEEVRRYLLKSQEEKFAVFEPHSIKVGNVELNIKDKIDLSKFDRKKGIVSDKENIYIIDTNVFVECPNIISRIDREYKIIVPATVLEELDKLKLKADINKRNLSEAVKNINRAFTNNFSKMEEADVSLLPSGFDKKNPDCLILSVALKFRDENPILLTSDNILQTRAKGLGITTISLKDFLKR